MQVGRRGLMESLAMLFWFTVSLQHWPLWSVVAFFDLGFRVRCRWERMNRGMKDNIEEAMHDG